jgi:hypothetical protein
VTFSRPPVPPPATPAKSQAKQPPPPVAPRPDITATFRSAVLDATSVNGPEFILTVAGKPHLVVELSTDPSFKPPPRTNASDPIRFFSTLTGQDSPSLPLPWTLQPGYRGRAEAGPAGTFRARYVLPSTLWKEFAKENGPNRLFYRAIAFSAFDENGQPAGTSYSWEKPTLEVPFPPFLIIRREKPSSTDDYVPPAARPSITPPDLIPLRIDASSRLMKDQKGVDTSAVTLRGVNISGLQHRQFNWPQPFPGTRVPTCGNSPLATKADDPPLAKNCPVDSTRWHESVGITQELFGQLKRMGKDCNVIRLTFNQDWVLRGLAPPPSEKTAAKSGEEYLKDIDQIISWAAGEGIYVILAMHTLRAVLKSDGTFDRIYEPHLPDANSVTCWRLLSQRYFGAPSVLFDLCNEPHPVENDRDNPFYTGIRVAKAEQWIELWHNWVRLLEEGLHSREFGREDRLLVVSGIHGAGRSSSLRQMPVRKLVEYGRSDEKPQSVDPTM